jgi:hypothetical protein
MDDVHPTTSAQYGDRALDGEATLGRVRWLLERHPQLRVTLFTTPDWRSRGVAPERRVLSSVPGVRHLVYATRPWPRGTLRIDRHQAFVRALSSLPRTELALHGLHHVGRGPRGVVECEGLSRAQGRRLINAGRRIMARAGLPVVNGFGPPAWHAPDALLDAMTDLSLAFVSSARDLDTPVAIDARAAGSGLTGVPLFKPAMLPRWPLVHIPVNFQATSTMARAVDIVEAGGLLSVKAHYLERLGSYVALDGLTDGYAASLDALFTTLTARFGASLWWTSMQELASHVAAAGRAAS